MQTQFLGLVAAGILALTVPVRSQYLVTPAEELHAQRGGVGIFAWDRREREVVVEALDRQINPHFESCRIYANGNTVFGQESDWEIEIEKAYPPPPGEETVHTQCWVVPSGMDDILRGRALRIQDKMKAPPFPRYLLRYTGAIALGLPIGVPNKLFMVGADGKAQALPIELTLPEMILAGFALTRYCGLGGDPVSKEEGTECKYMVDQISNFANDTRGELK